MNKALLLTGAYGRVATIADWNAGKDFQIVNGPYCSIRDTKLMKKDGYGIILLVAPNTMAVRINIDDAIAQTYKQPSLV